jgi:hypothetical protein
MEHHPVMFETTNQPSINHPLTIHLTTIKVMFETTNQLNICITILGCSTSVIFNAWSPGQFR